MPARTSGTLQYTRRAAYSGEMHRREGQSGYLVKLFWGAFCLAACPAVRANPIIYLTLDSNFSSDYSFYTYTDTAGQVESNIPIAPYITYLSGGSFNNTQVFTFCYDFNAPTVVGTQYAGTLETFSDPSDLEATYLINDLNILGMQNAPLATRGAISLAIWEIMNPSSTSSINPFPTDPAALSYEAAAANAVANGWWTSADAAQFPIWVPQDPSLQRLGVVLDGAPPVAMPEPANLGLMSLGVCGLALAGRVRRVRRQAICRGQ